jgi:hypothetical protein
MTMKILSPDGAPIEHIKGATKKAHEPQELARERVRLDQVLHTMYESFMRDITQPTDRPLTLDPNMDAVRKHYDTKWREVAKTVNESTMPITVREDAMADVMDKELKRMEMMHNAQIPLHQVQDLQKWDLLPLINTRRGMLHMNTRVCVAVDAEGNTTVWLRGPHERTEDWCSGWAPEPWRDPIVECANYTLGELNNLLAITRRPDVGQLNEDHMAMARTPDVVSRKPWYQFWH